MNAKSFIPLKNYFLLIINFLLIRLTISILSFSYPTSITLDNGDIFIVHKTGVTVTDPTCSVARNPNPVYDLSSDQLTEEKLSQVSIAKFSDGYIICTIKTDLLIFLNTGTYKTRLGSNTNFLSSIKYYSLIPHIIDGNNDHFFLAAYIYNSELNLEYFKFDPSENKIRRIKLEAFLDRFYDDAGWIL